MWSDQTGTGALVDPVNGIMDATQLVPGGPYQFGYTVVDPACGQSSALVAIFITGYPDPGGDTAISVCATDAPFDMSTRLIGTPQQGGIWTGPGGVPVSVIFDPATQPGGAYVYALAGTAPCADTSAILNITVEQPPQAGQDLAVQACNSGQLDLGTVLGPDADPGGAWIDQDGTGALSGVQVDLGGLEPGVLDILYVVDNTGCAADSASLALSVVDGVRIIDTLLTCNTVDRTYTVTLVLAGGDPGSYVVSGVPGVVSPQPPYTFVSEPILTSSPFNLTVDDANGCSPRVLTGATPCAFQEPVFVPESFTPNGDGTNDAFIIPGIEGYPLNRVDIFNRWGATVYTAAGYNNGTIRWDGTSADALIPGDLPTGTYFYVLDLGDGSPVLKGFVYLNR